ncbi:hypothetical protein CC85DRAFT_303894 [Cutaneotrichosporon oleaginosum]|uniref:Uncharacterized protein n=1 Tax=Cutaneotrichosporon oleaginosum TaxID=879819 RepID=A0A0J0XI44_9TREE|nr:uncharacterized protein CC85DRAFT_303894 [Cutaneotrichosporon oleaginosum]KLT40682.1 hypothetical protein CC85DRAFT_303894 [Cutaneotrichosporon oleaginosum]TXT14268.1 hypothetical protein COLE_00461 [Cutaneotrichosporon oleaginosum]
MPSLPPPSNSAPPVPNEQSLQASQPQDGEDKDIADSREAREQLLREKLRIKMAQRSAGQDANGSHPSSAAPSAREQPPDLADVTISSSTTHPSQEGAEISGPARLDTFSSNSNGHGGHPPDAGYAESRPAHDVSRPASHVARPALNEPPFDPSKSYAEAARQRFASYERNRYMPPRRRTPSPPPRRDPSPRRAVHLSSSRDRGPVSPSVRYERGDPPPEIAERGRADRRVSHSPVVERRLYERSHYPREHVREREFERPAQAVPPSTMPAPPATVVARDDLPPADTNPMETWAIESHGKAPSYKSHGPYNKQKPYDRRPYVRSPSSRGPSPSRVHYEARSRSSWDGRGPSSTKLDYRY